MIDPVAALPLTTKKALADLIWSLPQDVHTGFVPGTTEHYAYLCGRTAVRSELVHAIMKGGE